MALFVVVAFAENTHKVTSTTLNVRRAPSTGARVLGTLHKGDQIEVLQIARGWAKVNYNGSTGYVSEKYIAPLPDNIINKITKKKQNLTQTPRRPVRPKRQTSQPQQETEVTYTPKPENDYEVKTPLTMGHGLSDNINLYLAIQGGFGYSNFTWNDGPVYGTMSYSGDIMGQLYFERRTSFIPRNWYTELSLGYDKKGAAQFDMNYIHMNIYPFGYRIPIKPINIVVKAGPTLGFALNEFDGEWSSDFQVGVGGGLQIEWRQFAIGCNVEYDFTEVSSNCGETLHNFAVLGTISYKFAKFGHKK